MHAEQKTCCVYIVGSLAGTLYIGITSNLLRRAFQHKFHTIEGFTDKHQVERLVYWEWFGDVHKAIAREKQLKGWRRSKKIALIESLNPRWLDLARDWYPWMKSRETVGVLRLRRHDKKSESPFFLGSQRNASVFHTFPTAIPSLLYSPQRSPASQ